jgi:ribosome biogenesis GTPase
MPTTQAQVIATYSRRMRLRLAQDTEVEARIKGKKLKPVCGDYVTAEPINNEGDWLITGICDRENALARPNMRGQVEVLAANVDLLIVVAAAAPEPDWYILDRYLAAAENMRINAVVVFNKTDLATGDAETTKALDDYAQTGYPVFLCSAETEAGIEPLQQVIRDQTAIIVGQSGVGKSSIINVLMGGLTQRTKEISAKTGEGKHTTVNSIMLDLPEGGRIIDSPGVRDYAPALDSIPAVVAGFREIEKAGHDCRFANCRHLREPGCAVKSGVENDTISARRYESYRRLLFLTEKLEQRS